MEMGRCHSSTSHPAAPVGHGCTHRHTSVVCGIQPLALPFFPHKEITGCGLHAHPWEGMERTNPGLACVNVGSEQAQSVQQCCCVDEASLWGAASLSLGMGQRPSD